MTYEHIVAGTFISRPNRFIAHVETGNRTVVCHVKNTGRCRELLIPGVTVILEFHPDAVLSGRKTEYDLIGVYKNGLLINMDSQAPNKAAWEWLVSLGGGQYTEKNHYPLGSYVPFDIRREVTHGDSRFDLAFSLRNRDTKAVSPAFMEVKGVTLEESPGEEKGHVEEKFFQISSIGSRLFPTIPPILNFKVVVGVRFTSKLAR